MNIGIDFDGVIIDWVALKCRVIQILFSTTVTPARSSRTELLETEQLSERQYAQVIQYMYESEETASLVETLPYCVDGIRHILRKHACRIITAREKRNRRVVERILERFGLDALSVTYTDFAPKGPFCVDVHMHVDDDYRQLKTVIGHVPHPVLYTHPYNAHEAITPPCVRASDWKEITKLALSL